METNKRPLSLTGPLAAADQGLSIKRKREGAVGQKATGFAFRLPTAQDSPGKESSVAFNLANRPFRIKSEVEAVELDCETDLQPRKLSKRKQAARSSYGQLAKSVLAKQATRHRIWLHEMAKLASNQHSIHLAQQPVVLRLVDVLGSPTPDSLVALCSLPDAEHSVQVVFSPVMSGRPDRQIRLFRDGLALDAILEPALASFERAATQEARVLLLDDEADGLERAAGTFVCFQYALECIP